jgi:hypothetical protein
MGHALQVARHFQKSVIEPPEIETAQIDSTGGAVAQSGSEALKHDGAYIYSHLLGMKVYPYKDPETGKITKVVTEDGATFTEADLSALRVIRDTFGIEEMVRVLKPKISAPLNTCQQKTTSPDGNMTASQQNSIPASEGAL